MFGNNTMERCVANLENKQNRGDKIGIAYVCVQYPGDGVYYFAAETKATCIWTGGGLPTLKPTMIVSGREPRIHMMSPGPNRQRERSRTFPGIAKAMADQWGRLLKEGERL